MKNQIYIKLLNYISLSIGLSFATVDFVCVNSGVTWTGSTRFEHCIFGLAGGPFEFSFAWIASTIVESTAVTCLMFKLNV